jgi:hypothetical protein
MKTLVFAALGIQAVASLVVGWRLLKLARESRQLPELALALASLMLPAVGFPLMVVSVVLEKSAVGGAVFAHLLGGLSVAAASTMYWVFTWRVFRPDSRIAAVGTAVAALVYLACVCLASRVASDHGIVGSRAFMGWWRYGYPVFMLLGFCWTLFESLRYYGALRKRARLGIGDAAVCNRFLLFAGLAATWVLTAACLLIVYVFRLGPFETPWFMAAIAAAGSLNAICLVFAFMPPCWYVTRFAQREEERELI